MSMDFSRVAGGASGAVQGGMQQYVDVSTGNVKSTSILSGVPVTVTEAGDYEKLLAEAQKERDRQNIDYAKVKLSLALSTIIGLATGLAEAQAAALTDIEVATKQLEALTEAYTVTEEERNAKLETEQTLKEEISSLEKEIASLDMSKKGSEAKKAQLEEQLSQKKTALSSVQGEIANLNASLADLQSQINACVKTINDAVAVLNEDSLAVLGVAIRLTASDVMTNYNAAVKEGKTIDDERQFVWDVLNDAYEKAMADLKAEIEAKRTTNV